jgi:hypothetical protein
VALGGGVRWLNSGRRQRGKVSRPRGLGCPEEKWKRLCNFFSAYLNLNSKFKFKSNAFLNSYKFKPFSKNINLKLLNQNNFETQFKF